MNKIFIFKLGLSFLSTFPVWILCKPWIALTTSALVYLTLSIITWLYDVIIESIYLSLADKAEQEVSLEEMKAVIERDVDFINYIKMSIRYRFTGRMK